MSESNRLVLRLLGEIEVVRAGEPVVLPASRKTRALLAYLAATERSHRRTRLCALLWDVPDDPRGALRSSLSKLRAVVDQPDRQRIVADRDTVRFDGTDVDIDLVRVRRLLASGGAVTTEALETAARAFRGDFAGDLMLSSCPDFHAWCVAEREEARRLQVRILRLLIERHEGTPEAALTHARALARVDAKAASAHTALLRLLIASGRGHEAEEQQALSQRALAEVGDVAVYELTQAWRDLVGKPVAARTTRASDGAGAGDAEPIHPVAEAAGAADAAGWSDKELSPEPPPGKPSIVVLPFTNLSDDPSQEYFSDGVTEDIITDLSRVSAIFVVARSTAFAFKGKPVDIGQLARRLHVAYVLEGGVRKAEGRVRVTVRLVEAATGGHLWAERFDREFADIFALQEDISTSVVAALKLRLLPEELQAISRHPTSSAQAYRYYLEARAKLEQSWGTKELLRAARRLFAKAVKLDCGYAAAFAGMADCDAFLWISGDLDVSCEQILTNSARARELAPDLAESHASVGVAHYVAGQTLEAIAAFERAIELDPELFQAHYMSAFCRRDTGDFQGAAAHFERAAQIQPRNYGPFTLLADVYAALGRRERSLIAAREALSRIEAAFGREPDVAEVLAMGATTLVGLGDFERAEMWAKRAVLLDPESHSVCYNAACTYAVIGKPHVAQACLEFAFSHMPRARCWLLKIATHDAQLDSLRGRPEFESLMKRLEADVATPSPPVAGSPASRLEFQSLIGLGL